MKNLHCAYNLITGEILEAPSDASLRKHLKFIQRIDRESFGLYKCEWRFGHQGVAALIDRIQKRGEY